MRLFGEKNGFWKGGRVIASNGYVLVRVGVDHPLADVRGYAYEHRIVAAIKFGRLPQPGEHVHHVDGDKRNNDPDNLEIVSTKQHGVLHRSPGSPIVQLPDEINPLVQCACGCGTELLLYDEYGRRRQYVSGHNLFG